MRISFYEGQGLLSSRKRPCSYDCNSEARDAHGDRHFRTAPVGALERMLDGFPWLGREQIGALATELAQFRHSRQARGPCAPASRPPSRARGRGGAAPIRFAPEMCNV
jgi:hypothetical protein